ncbi:MAG: hypothetical protein IKE52_01315 [Mogibacterium sp.]|nr:hypothetical protein [Mogibacterium sp.]
MAKYPSVLVSSLTATFTHYFSSLAISFLYDSCNNIITSAGQEAAIPKLSNYSTTTSQPLRNYSTATSHQLTS